MSLCAVLEDSGYRVTTAEGREAGVQTCLTDEVDLIFTDLQMPDNDGVDVIHSLREHAGNIDIVAMSGVGIEATSRIIGDVEDQTRLHPLAKPVRPDELLSLVRSLVG